MTAAVFTLLLACNSSDDKTTEDKKDAATEASTADKSNDPIYQKGLTLEANNDCKTCHGIDTRIKGPSYQEIAAKYSSMPDTTVSRLADKIIKGGNDGSWGVPDQMTPHPGLAKEDAEALVRYIFTYKK